MEMPHDRHKPPEGLGEQRTANELVKLIRKLRWMGLEGEAEHVQMAQCRGPAGDAVLAAPHETD